jgi:alpha-tubulin suppressor-like RCC1 family protein
MVDSALWTSANAGHSFGVGIRANGALYTWGYNYHGQLGNGNTISTNSPVLVSSSIGWKQVDCGFYFAIGIKNDGTLWAWGNNEFGQFGNGSTGTSSSSTNQIGGVPIQIGSANNWDKISATNIFSSSIKTDGTLWAWGKLGNGSIINTTTPLQIGSSNDWITSSANGSYAINSNNDLWIFSSNNQISCSTLNISENSITADYEFYPNPVKEILYFSNDLPDEFQIFDIVGKLIAQGRRTNNYIDVSFLTSGIYIIKLIDEKNITVTKKFIKS